MNLQAILIANMFGLILLICVFISIILTKQNRRLSDKIFMALIFLVILSGWKAGGIELLCQSYRQYLPLYRKRYMRFPLDCLCGYQALQE